MEAEHFGSQGPQSTVALEKDELEEDKKNLLLKFLKYIKVYHRKTVNHTLHLNRITKTHVNIHSCC